MYILNHDGKMYRKFFEDIAAIPHESYNEKALSDYIVKFAEDRNLWHHQDEVWNVIVKKPASPGYEDHDPVMIQGHIDMVCVKTPNSKHDFNVDPLELYVDENGFLRAKDTTLGADCGHGISYMLSILDDTTLKHPPIECVFTVQEEVGIGGPKYIDYSLLEARRLIFTDSMEEGRPELSTTSVLGGDFSKSFPLVQACSSNGYRIKIEGLSGGHAAADINSGRASAIKLLSRILYGLSKEAETSIVSFNGGTMRNNIPNKAEAVICVSDDSFDVEKYVASLGDEFKIEFRKTESALSVECEVCNDFFESISPQDTREILSWIIGIPSDTIFTDPEDHSFPWTSANLGTTVIADGNFSAQYQIRSSIKSHITMVFNQVEILGGKFGIEWEEKFQYPGYVVQEGTLMYTLYDDAYFELTGKHIVPKHIHAGTDVGTFIEKLENLDVVGIGPNTYHFHTPNECMELASYDRAYKCITMVLERL